MALGIGRSGTALPTCETAPQSISLDEFAKDAAENDGARRATREPSRFALLESKKKQIPRPAGLEMTPFRAIDIAFDTTPTAPLRHRHETTSVESATG